MLLLIFNVNIPVDLLLKLILRVASEAIVVNVDGNTTSDEIYSELHVNPDAPTLPL